MLKDYGSITEDSTPFGDLLRTAGKLYRELKRSKDDLSRKPKN